jgi:hypothetical protein
MLQPANPDILEGVDDLIKLSYLNEPAVLHDLTHRYAQDKIYVRANTSLIPASKIIWGYPCASTTKEYSSTCKYLFSSWLIYKGTVYGCFLSSGIPDGCKKFFAAAHVPFRLGL